jgi:hypothetical protein
MAGPAVVVVASLASAWIAVRSDDGVVAEDYYKLGMLINRKIASSPVDTRGNAGATIDVAENGTVRVHLQGVPLTPAHLRLGLAEPGLTHREQVIALTPDSEGGWVGELKQQTSGRRMLRLEIDDWQLPITTVVGRIGEVRLGAAAPRS